MGKISEKDRSQLLRMAGNIAGGLVSGMASTKTDINAKEIACFSVLLAMETMMAVDAEIGKHDEH